MRKFTYAIVMDSNTFAPQVIIREKDEAGNITELLNKPVEQHPLSNKYSTTEITKIDTVNKLLKERNEAELTEEEMDHLVDPLHLKQLEALVQTPEDMQQLAGFRVEKKIINLT